MNAPSRDALARRAISETAAIAAYPATVYPAPASHGAPLPADRIFVRDLVLPIAVGVYDEEQGILQKVAFSVEAEVAPSIRATEDDIATVPSYDDIVKAIRAIVAAGHINLTETLAERIAAACLAEPRIARVTVRVEKLERGPAGVGVVITRARRD